MRASPSRSRRTLRLLGILLLATVPVLAVAKEVTDRRVVADYHRLLATTTPRDSVVRASASYHWAFAQRALDGRWRPTGHGTAGVLGLVAGVALLALSRRRSTG